MFCSHCGQKIDGTVDFCSQCGQPILAEHRIQVTGIQQDPSLIPLQKPIHSRFLKQLFGVVWLILAILGLLLLIGRFSVPLLVVVLAVLSLLFFLRRRLFTGWFKSIAVFVLSVAVLIVPLAFLSDDHGLGNDVAQMENAFLSNDIEQVAPFIHPEATADLLPVLSAHEAELARIGQMMSTRKLIYADDFYAEFEVTDHGQTFILVFQKYDGRWRLTRL